jgi:hypothetical protein
MVGCFMPLAMCLALVILLLLWIPHPAFRGSLVLPGIETVGDLAVCLAKRRHGEPAAGGNAR